MKERNKKIGFVKSKLCFSLAAILVVAGCTTATIKEGSNLKDDEIRKVTILHTNDHHGRFWKNSKGEYGMSARKTLIDGIRAEKKADGSIVLLLSGGDINTGVPESDIQDAEPDFKGMNRIGYDAMAIGNHEFDNPPKVLKKQQKWSNFPFLSANIYNKTTGKRAFDAYKIFQFDGLKVAVVGFTTEDTQKIGNPEYLSNLEFRSPVEEAKKIVPELRNKVDLLVAVTHMGHFQNAEHKINAPGDVSMARAVKGFDIIVGGHSQEPVCMEKDGKGMDKSFAPGKECTPDRQNGTWIVQAYEWGKYVGKADFLVSKNEVKLVDYALIPVNLKVKKKDAKGNTVKDAKGKSVRVFATSEIKENQEMKDFLTPYQEKGSEKLNIKVGSSAVKLEGGRDKVRYVPTNLGFMIADAQRQKVNADIGIINGGGIRNSIEAGDITFKDILGVHPFGNTITVIELTGAELTDYLKVAAARPADTGSFCHFAGVDITIKGGKLVKALVNGSEIDNSKKYKLSINSFMAAGGDGMPKVNNLNGYVNTGFLDADVLREYIEKNSPIKASDIDPSKSTKRM